MKLKNPIKNICLRVVAVYPITFVSGRRTLAISLIDVHNAVLYQHL